MFRPTGYTVFLCDKCNRNTTKDRKYYTIPKKL